MIRSFTGAYKHGRSTVKEGLIGKIKKFAQSEAVIIGFEERMHNANEAKTDALGHTERSSHKENLIGRGDLGSIVVRLLSNPAVTFSIGSGFNDAERQHIWDNKESYLKKIVTFKYFDIGGYDAPRFPIYIGIRDKADM
jgi:DNA ligase-1